MTPLSPALSYHSLRPCYRLEGKGPGPDGEPWPCTAGVLMPATSQHPTRSTAAPKRRETRGPGWEAKEAARGLGQAGRLTLCLRFSRKEDMGFEVHELWRRIGTLAGWPAQWWGLVDHRTYFAWLSPRGVRSTSSTAVSGSP